MCEAVAAPITLAFAVACAALIIKANELIGKLLDKIISIRRRRAGKS